MFLKISSFKKIFFIFPHPRFVLTLLFGLFLLSVSAASDAQDIPARPEPPRLVNDFAHVLSQQQKNALEQKLVAYDDSTSTQIAIVTIETTGGYAMVDYAVKLGREWGVGGKKFDNGIIVLVATGDQKVFIATGYGMEGAIPDIIAKQIIDHSILPEFRKGDFYEGLNLATNNLIKAAAGEYKAPKNYHKQQKSSSGGLFFFVFILIVLFFVFMSRKRGGGDDDGDGYNRRGRGYGLGPFLGGMFLGGMLGGGRGRGGFGGGGFGGGGFGGGGFGGFGGGGFGGGGAGGGW